MPKNLSNSVKVQILIGVAVMVLGAAVLKLWDRHDARVNAAEDLKDKVALLQEKVDLMGKQLDLVWADAYGVERRQK
jgi:hypothetical protein